MGAVVALRALLMANYLTLAFGGPCTPVDSCPKLSDGLPGKKNSFFKKDGWDFWMDFFFAKSHPNIGLTSKNGDGSWLCFFSTRNGFIDVFHNFGYVLVETVDPPTNSLGRFFIMDRDQGCIVLSMMSLNMLTSIEMWNSLRRTRAGDMLAVVFQGVSVVLLLSKIHFFASRNTFWYTRYPVFSHVRHAWCVTAGWKCVCDMSWVIGPMGKLQRPTTADSKKKNTFWVS